MNPAHKRIAEMASGWEGSRAEITLSPADAQILEGVGAKLTRGRGEDGPITITAPELCAAAGDLILATIPSATVAAPEPEIPADDGLEKKTVAELRAIAAAESVTVAADAKKADVIEAIRKARAAK